MIAEHASLATPSTNPSLSGNSPPEAKNGATRIDSPAATNGRADQESAMPSRRQIRPIVSLFRLLADDTRVRILHTLLVCEEMHVRALCDLLKQSQPAVSHHLALLRSAKLIERRRAGKHNFYRLIAEGCEPLFDLAGMIVTAKPNEQRATVVNTSPFARGAT